MNPIISITIGLSMAVFSTQLFAQESANSSHASPYAGFETRAIKSLSEADIEELRRGGGWGLALPAELNGVPGPAHLLELKNEMGLSPEQIAAIEEIFTEMQAEATMFGEQLIAAEQAIEEAFVSGNLGDDRLRVLIEDAETARANLRFVHLSRHLLTPPLLTEDQIVLYKTLRGYGSDPCTNVPEGHDADKWRQHNGCE
ncbi:hypothetical protein A9Q96_09645 [Rhodobacterales bacterium 52_120_T64]|nr:hypothetical protein A9Q96_09645 [Rhodobacterales bacterium 52_120_T64]